MTHRHLHRAVLVVGVVVLAATSTVVVAALTNGFGSSDVPALRTCEPATTAHQVVQVGLYDGGGMMMGPRAMMLRLVPDPSSVRAGRVTFVVTNYGELNHEFLVLPMPRDGVGTRRTGANGQINESQSLGEASTSCGEGPGDGISPGARSWVTLDLRAGSYELLCDIPWHYADGMFAAFTVT